MPAPNTLQELCRFLGEVSIDQIPAGAVRQAERILLDTIGVMVAGQDQPEVNALAEKFTRRPPAGSVVCPGRAELLAPLEAVLVGGAAASSLEFEEGNSLALGHPAVQIVPALLVKAQEINASGDRLLTALIGGYETAFRVSRAASMRKGLHPNGAWGVAGGAAGLGLLRGLSPGDLEQLVRMAASYAFSPYVRNSFAGWSAAATFAAAANHAALLADLFFEAGYRADPAGFEMTFSRFLSEGLDPELLSPAPGDLFAVEFNYFKPYPTCRFTQPALEALKEALGGREASPDDVERIEVRSFGAAVHAGSGAPGNVEALRFSSSHLVAAYLVRGRIDREVLTEDLVRDPEVLRLAERVELILDEDYEGMRPERSPARVVVRMRDGRELTGEVLDCRGDSRNPLSDVDLEDKFLENVAGALGRERGRTVIDELTRLRDAPGVAPWIRLLQREAEGP